MAAYEPGEITFDLWASPITIEGVDLITELDDTVNEIITLDTASLTNHYNNEMVKLSAYLVEELTLMGVTAEEQAALSKAWAAGTLPDGAGTFSSREYSEQSGVSAAAALASQNAARISETNTAADKNAARISETNAAASQNAAGISETNAAASENAAAASKINAAASAAEAAGSEDDKWNAEAAQLTADSYATQTEDVFVNVYTSNGDGTFTATPTIEYSALHWAAKAAAVPALNPDFETLKVEGNYVSPFAMRNKLINGGFDVWQRGESFADIGGSFTFTADRWYVFSAGQTSGGVDVQHIKPTTPELGDINISDYLRIVNNTVGGTYARISQNIEGVMQSDGKAFTVSCWMRGSVDRPITIEVRQNLGGGTADLNVGAQFFNVTNSWTKFSATFNLLDLAGQIIDTDSFIRLTITDILGFTEGATLDVANVQLEEGSVATPFEKRPIGLELSLCQRYYLGNQVGAGSKGYKYAPAAGVNYDGLSFSFPVEMRTIPTVVHNQNLYVNCTFGDNLLNASGLNLRVSPSAEGVYSVHSGTSDFDAEL